ncbi:Os04g0679400, partial [Oryza sativa Japonica Group]
HLLRVHGEAGQPEQPDPAVRAVQPLHQRGAARHRGLPHPPRPRPLPRRPVVKDLSGSFAFVVFDNKSGAVFPALSTDGEVPLYWGIAADGSVVICDEREIVKGGCGKSYAPFPVGCMFHSEGGLKSFEHPMNRLKAMPRVDSEGVMCGATFKVDTFTKINSMPRVGSATNWAATWDDAAA